MKIEPTHPVLHSPSLLAPPKQQPSDTPASLAPQGHNGPLPPLHPTPQDSMEVYEVLLTLQKM